MSVPRVQFDCRGSPGDIRPVSATASTRSTKFTERDRRALFSPAGRVIPTCNVATHEVIRRTNGSTVHSTVWVLPPPAPSFRHTCRDRPSCAGFYCSCGAGLSKLQPGLASMPAGRTQDHRDDDTAKSVPGLRIKKKSASFGIQYSRPIGCVLIGYIREGERSILVAFRHRLCC